jgi:hypothetical protein
MTKARYLELDRQIGAAWTQAALDAVEAQVARESDARRYRETLYRSIGQMRATLTAWRSVVLAFCDVRPAPPGSYWASAGAES